MGVIGGLLGAAAAFVGAAWLGQRRLVYLPTQRLPSVADVLAGAEDVTLATEDGLRLAAWWLPVPGATVAVMVLHGNAGNRSGRAPLASALAQFGLSALLVDYRGYGGNPGRPTERGLLADARAARAWLDARGDVRRTVYFGESLGAAVAAALAAETPPAALILRSPFVSLAEVARVHYPVVPDWFLRDRYATVDHVAEVAVPVLVVAGERDDIVPPDQSRRVYEVAAGPKRFVEIAGADHNDPALLTGDRLLAAVESFLAEHRP
ncbi:MAG: alpha/beta hydrolase [Actinobacteria bacterium]|nr:alpha/beta hydrolase [Actinomycetota bacterium]